MLFTEWPRDEKIEQSTHSSNHTSYQKLIVISRNQYFFHGTVTHCWCSAYNIVYNLLTVIAMCTQVSTLSHNRSSPPLASSSSSNFQSNFFHTFKDLVFPPCSWSQCRSGRLSLIIFVYFIRVFPKESIPFSLILILNPFFLSSMCSAHLNLMSIIALNISGSPNSSPIVVISSPNAFFQRRTIFQSIFCKR